MKYLILCFTVFISIQLHGQVSIVFPHNRQVFQRDADNEARLSILGNCSQDVSSIQYKLEPVKAGQGTLINWTNMNSKPVAGFFQEIITAKGGWYTLKIRTYQGTQLKDSTQLDRVGVGENFIISGQSNAQGGNGRRSEESFSKDDRVNVANIYNYYKDYNNSPFYRYLGQLNTDFPFTDFQHLDAKNTIGPMGLSNYYWARLGDRLTETYNVPVCFINTAWLATAMRNWYESSLPDAKPSANPFDPTLFYDAGFPFKNLKRAVELFGKKNGVRAILWHQGETDAFGLRYDPIELKKAKTDTYQQNFKDMIKNLRSQTGIDVPWLISRVSYSAGIANGVCSIEYKDELLIRKQSDMVSEVSGIPEIYLGPYTDVVEIPRKTDDFSGCVHFSPDAYEELAYLWLEKIGDAIGKNAKPISPKPLPSFSVICDNSNATTLGIATQDSIQWLNEKAQLLSKVSTIPKAQSGSYSLRLQDGVGNEFSVPLFQFKPLQAPATPIILVKGDTLFCQGNSVELQVAANPDLNYVWNTGAQNSIITVKDKGSFQVKGTNNYQCTTAFSKAVSTKVFDIPSAPVITQESPYFLKTSVLKASDTNLFWELNQNTLPEKSTLLRVRDSGTYSLYLTKTYVPGPTCASPKASYSYTLPDDMGVVVFPNPVVNTLSIQARTSLAGALVKIYTLDGRLVMDSQISQDGSAQLSVQHLSQGLYKLWVRTNDQMEFVKNIIVSH